MSKLTAERASSEAFIPLVQELAAADQAFSLYDAEGLRTSGSNLTPSQARVIFTIGDTEGRTLGAHEGLGGFTVGQRKGLGLGGGGERSYP